MTTPIKRKRPSISPTQRSLKYLRDKGYFCEVVEKWNPWTKQRKDLWDWCDILAIRKGEVLAVQVTSSGVAARIRKIVNSETIGVVREAGIRVEVHGWTRSKKDGLFKIRVEDLS